MKPRLIIQWMKNIETRKQFGISFKDPLSSYFGTKVCQKDGDNLIPMTRAMTR